MINANHTASTIKANSPIFSVKTETNGAIHLQGIGDQRDEIASWVIYRLVNPKAKILENNKLNKDGAWQSMSRQASLKAVERKPVTLDEQQDCWQTCMALLLQNAHLKGDAMVLPNGKPFAIAGTALHQGVYDLFAACRDILRINNRKSDYCESLDYLLESGKDFIMPHKEEKHGVQRIMRANAFRENMKLIRLSFSMDKSRQRESNKRNAIRFMREIADGSVARLSKTTRSMRKAAFLEYIGFSKIVQDTNLESLAQDMMAI